MKKTKTSSTLTVVLNSVRGVDGKDLTNHGDENNKKVCTKMTFQLNVTDENSNLTLDFNKKCLTDKKNPHSFTCSGYHIQLKILCWHV